MRKVSGRLVKEIEELRRMKDEEIDLTDIPETADWSKAVVGRFYRPVKESLTIRIDADVLDWLRGQGKGYQTRINALLRETMERAHGRWKPTHRSGGGIMIAADARKQEASRLRPTQAKLRPTQAKLRPSQGRMHGRHRESH